MPLMEPDLVIVARRDVDGRSVDRVLAHLDGWRASRRG
jgi:hypothetical protein